MRETHHELREDPIGATMSTLISMILGKTRRERVSNVVSYLLAAAVLYLALELKWASKSPNPAEWNYYSQEANDHLYAGASVCRPDILPVVAHGGGSIPDSPNASPLERLSYNYKRGHRLFELDFSWTADNEIVVKHDWRSVASVPTLEEFLQELPGRNASLAMIYSWMETNPKAFIVTDCKKRNLEFIAKVRMERPELVHRFIVQLYQFKDYDLAQTQGYRHMILTLYRCLSNTADDKIVAFAKSHPLFAVTMPKDRCCETDLAKRLAQIGVHVFAHTINDQAIAQTIQSSGGYGVYSDTLRIHDLSRIGTIQENSLR